MREQDFPALFRAADAASNKFQARFLWLVGGEYFLLIIASVLSMQMFSGADYNLAFAAVLLCAMVILLTRALLKPQQDWYRCRALAESVKTLTWRYVMRAEPFNGTVSDATPRQHFRDQLHELFQVNHGAAEKVDDEWSADDQITAAMEEVHALSVSDRIEKYLHGRIRSQRRWYARKARWNRSKAITWVSIGVFSYVVAAAMAIVRVRYPQWQIWPIDPVIVIASSVIGWSQIKRYSELAVSYKLTAQEIGLITPKLDGVDSEAELSRFVNEAEQAFSREHTMWIARQTS